VVRCGAELAWRNFRLLYVVVVFFVVVVVVVVVIVAAAAAIDPGYLETWYIRGLC